MTKIFRQWLGIAGLTIVTACPAQAGQGTAWLSEFFSQVKVFKAEFSQLVVDESHREVQRSSGVVYLARPKQFRWDYKKPYEQLIVGDGEKIWIYEPDLEQVTVKHQDEAVGDTPAQMLASDVAVEQNFIVNELGIREGEAWVELTPKHEETTFLLIRLAFREGMLSKMELRDSLGNSTKLVFTQAQSNPVLASDIFAFNPPKDVDVFGP